jgi:cell division initiation protein
MRGGPVHPEEPVRFTPLDIQSHRFSRRLRGFDATEVDAFLELVAEDYESLLRERDALANRVRVLERRVEDLASTEKALQDSILTAHSLSEDLKKTAVREAEVRLGEAEVKAEKILEASHRRAARLAEDIREMKVLRQRLGTALRTTIETHLALLESLTGAHEEEIDDGKVAYLARPKAGASEG